MNYLRRFGPVFSMGEGSGHEVIGGVWIFDGY